MTDTTTVTAPEMAELVRRMVEGKDGIVFADLFAADGVLEYPFTPPGFPAVIEGQEAIRALHSTTSKFRRLFDMAEVTSVVHQTHDPEVVVVEIEHRGMSHVTHRPYRMLSLSIIRVRDSRIVHCRDFMNPIALAEMTGRMPDLIAALSAPESSGSNSQIS